MEHFIVLKFKNTEHRDAFWESTGQHMGISLSFRTEPSRCILIEGLNFI